MKKAAPKPEPLPLPEFTSDRMRLLAPLITPRVLELARLRLTNHKARISDAEDDLPTKRVAILILLEMNPAAFLTNGEEGIRRGMDADTYGKKRAAREI